MERKILCLAYYFFARNLPQIDLPFGKKSNYLRTSIAKRLFKSFGKGSGVGHGAFFHSGRNISIGCNSAVGINAVLNGKITIGDNVMMGRDVIFQTINHAFSRLDIPMNKQGFQDEGPVTIKNDVWIGDRVIILPGVTIGNGAIIGAGSIVTKSIPDYAIACGVPAVVKKFRHEQSKQERQE